MRPRSAVEAFHYSTVRQVGIIVYFYKGKSTAGRNRAFHQLLQGLYAVESTAFVESRDGDSFFIDNKGIGTRHRFYIGLTGNFLSEINRQFNSFLVRRKEIEVPRKFILLVFQVDTLRKVARFSGHRHNLMRLRIQDKSFVVYFFSGNSSYILFL